MRQIWTSRKVWLPILLLFTAVLIFACWDRGVAIDFDGTGLYHASPLDSAIETVPVSFHGHALVTVSGRPAVAGGVLQTVGGVQDGEQLFRLHGGASLHFSTV